MKQIIKSYLRQFLFWMLFFALMRLVFLLYYLPLVRVSGAGFWETAAGFLHALKLDTATAAYLMMIPMILLTIRSVWPKKILDRLNKIYTAIMIFLYTLITMGEIGLYEEWKTKLNFKALMYLRHPAEVVNSADTSVFVLLVILLVLFTVSAIMIYSKFFYRNLRQNRTGYLYALLFFLITSGISVVVMRGGFQQIPINQSEAYYSKKNILNQAATNNLFNLYINVTENLQNLHGNPFLFYPLAEAKMTVDDLYRIEKDTTVRILTTPRPNVVLLILESWSADLIESLGGKPGITPEFHKLEQQGILFDQMLSSGSRSELGMASIFGGFPATPISSVTIQPDKHHNLPSLVHELNRENYSTSFYFGGQLIYGNIKAYIYYNAFKRVIEGKDFDKNGVVEGKLGVHDEFTLKRLLGDLENEKEPFFAALFTLSSHSPFDEPMDEVLHWGGNEKDYINSAYYTDRCLGEFFREARKQKWYDSTLFILVADHSHNSYNNWPYHTVEYHRIPMLFYGEVIRPEYRGVRWSQPGSQVDIPATLLAQMGLPHEKFHWSRDMFNPYSPKFRYFGFDNGVIWTEPGGSFGYNAGLHRYCWDLPEDFDTAIIKHGKSYLEVVFDEYLNY